ncbi:MAG: response regulator, partial [Pseudomonadota bacterium]
SSTRTHEGTGLGLAIAKGIVEAMGGRIGVQSKPGAGATFWFELPLPVAESVPQVKATAVNVAGKRALVVDDNETNRYIARELMRSWRMHESSASSGRECLEMLRAAAGREQPFDVVILDQQMPGLDGDATMAAIRADHAIRDTAIVMLSSLDSAIGGARADARADQYLVKPAPASALYDAIATSLSDAASRKLAAAEPVMAKAEARPKPAPAATGEPVPTRGVVLLVEDNQVNRLVAKQILAAAPIRVVEAHNGAEALDMVAVHQPDVILMDVSMPVMNGHEATRRIRERERAQQLTPTLIVGMTAHAMAGDRAKCIEAGMDDYLPKPVDGEKLLGIIEEQFHRSEVPTIDREAS